MSEPLRLLLLEDSAFDAELNEQVLHRAGIDFTSLLVETQEDFVAALDSFKPDVILADYNLPGFDGLQALAIAKKKAPRTPYIFVSGAMGEEVAIHSIQQGASDYILKDRLTRLPAAVQRALAEKKLHKQQREAEEKFRKITESAQDAIIMMGADQRISLWNDAAERIFGYTAAEAIGKNLHAMIVPAPAQSSFAHAFPKFQTTGKGPAVGKLIEVSALRKGGEEFPVELSVSATRLNGQWHAIGIVRDITSRKEVEASLKELSAHLQTVREEEKANIAREIHDELGGILTALKIDLYWLGLKLPVHEETTMLAARIETMSQLLDTAVTSTRRIITELRPTMLDDLGLLAAIEWQAAQFQKRTGIECRVNCLKDNSKLDKQRSIVMFRILQESLTNVLRHSGASCVEIEFCHNDNAVSLRISDNGCGLKEKNADGTNHFGIRGMVERATSLGGQLTIENRTKAGLTVAAVLPLSNETIRDSA